MKAWKWIGIPFVVLLLVVTIGLSGYYYWLRPVYEGEQDVKGLKSVTTVYSDTYGIPHIYAENEHDAQFMLGYVHARDRLFQMEVLRRIAPGRLSELFGSKTLKTDCFFATIGIDEAADKAISKLDHNTPEYKMTMAYLDGVNAYLKECKAPVEFTLLGIKKTAFTIKDVYNIFGYMSFSFAMAQKTDPLLTSIRDRYGEAYLRDFGIDSISNSKYIRSFPGTIKEYTAVSKSITALLEQTPAPAFMGSNSWVIGPEKTAKGQVIFANDPHIGFSQPAIWYEAHLSSHDREIYGFYLAGTPFPLLGHNRYYAYGLTMFENDDVDFFAEKEDAAHPNTYKVKELFEPYVFSEKTIIVKDSSNVRLTIKKSKHGPLINGVLAGVEAKVPLSMSWIYTQEPNHILKAVYGISHANGDMRHFKDAVSLISAPGLNVMYGDARGNIGWFASGKLYQREAGINRSFILDGSNNKDDRKTFLGNDKNPSAVNPDWHYVYSANNQPESPDGSLYPGYYLPSDRAQRIDTLLSSKNDWTAAGVKEMMLDNISPSAKNNISIMLQQLGRIKKSGRGNKTKAVRYLEAWEGASGVSEIAPVIYNYWLYYYLENTFKDELGEEGFTTFLGTHAMKQMIPVQLRDQSSPWWDNVKTKRTETRREILKLSFLQAIRRLEIRFGTNMRNWKWGAVHRLEHNHPLGSVKLLRPLFNVGSFPMAGSNEVINNQIFVYSKESNLDVKAGPSSRRVIDFSDIEHASGILPTGESGNPASSHYRDQAEAYNKGVFRPMLLNRKEIEKVSQKMVFRP